MQSRDAIPTRAPESAAHGLTETRGHSFARRRILLAQEVVDALITESGVEQHIELLVETRWQRGGEGEQALDAPRHLGGAAIAVAHHAFDPSWVRRAPADDASDLLDEAPHPPRLGAGGVGVV